MLTEQDIIRELWAACHQVGSQRAWASRNGLSESYVSDVLNGNRDPGEVMLTALGFRRVVGYVVIEGASNGSK